MKYEVPKTVISDPIVLVIKIPRERLKKSIKLQTVSEVSRPPPPPPTATSDIF